MTLEHLPPYTPHPYRFVTMYQSDYTTQSLQEKKPAVKSHESKRTRRNPIMTAWKIVFIMAAAVAVLIWGSAFAQSGLNYQVAEGNIKVVQELISQGADVNASGEEGTRPLHWAATYGFVEDMDKIVKLLVENGADINGRDDLGRTPLHYAMESRKLMNGGHVEVAKALLFSGAEVNVVDSRGVTPLLRLMASTYSNLAAQNAESFPNALRGTVRSLTLVELLIVAGADVNIRDNDGNSPLYTAAEWGNYTNVVLLVRNGAKFTTRDEKGRWNVVPGNNPICAAAMHYGRDGQDGKYTRIADFLRSKGGVCVSGSGG